MTPEFAFKLGQLFGALLHFFFFIESSSFGARGISGRRILEF